MSLEVLQSIQQAEAEAERTKQDALKQAREIIKSVESACAMAERTAAADQRAEYQRLLDKANQAVSQSLADGSAAAAAASAKLMERTEQRLDQAASLIFERVVKHGDR